MTQQQRIDILMSNKFSEESAYLLTLPQTPHRIRLRRLRQDLAGLTPRRSRERVISVRQQRAWGNHEEG